MLTDAERRASLRGTVAVTDATGTVTTLDTRAAQPAGPLALEQEESTPRWIGILPIGVLALAVAALGVVLIQRVAVRRRPERTDDPVD
jgi:hypothetical protein